MARKQWEKNEKVSLRLVETHLLRQVVEIRLGLFPDPRDASKELVEVRH